MKKILSILLILAFMLTGCGFVQIEEPTQEMVAKMLGRRVGVMFAQEKPEIACQQIGLDSLLNNLNPADSADIRDLLELVEIEGEDSPLIEAAKEGFKEGLKLGGCK